MADYLIMLGSFCFLALYWFFTWRRYKMYISRIYVAEVYDLTQSPPKLLGSFIFSAVSGEDARKRAFAELKQQDIYRENSDVRDLALFEEFGGDAAGHEFDVLPEALRRVRFNIRPF